MLHPVLGNSRQFDQAALQGPQPMDQPPAHQMDGLVRADADLVLEDLPVAFAVEAAALRLLEAGEQVSHLE